MKSQDIQIIVAMSGGVDSSVTAALLQEREFNVRGVYMKNWVDPEWPCPWQEEKRDAMAVCAKLGIPFDTWDFSKEYYDSVTKYMIREYKEGRTPNPDVMCNREIKFGIFLKRALKEGADYIATGHYVRLRRTDQTDEIDKNDKHVYQEKLLTKRSDSTSLLLQAIDQNKDQSYFLWTLTQNELKHCLFPIGDYTKPEVRALAKKFGLPTAEKKDSQGICFVGKIPVRNFLKTKIPERPGEIITPDGKIVGSHNGISYYTIGQRHGIGAFGGGKPLYIVKKEPETNRLTVAPKNADVRYRQKFEIKETSWVSGIAPQKPFLAHIRTRYRAPLNACTVSSKKPGVFEILCENPERAVTPGQSAVLYGKNGSDTEVLGGGIISA